MTGPEPLYRAIRILISEWHIQAKLMSLEVGESKVYAFQLQIAVHGDVIKPMESLNTYLHKNKKTKTT